MHCIIISQVNLKSSNILGKCHVCTYMHPLNERTRNSREMVYRMRFTK